MRKSEYAALPQCIEMQRVTAGPQFSAEQRAAARAAAEGAIEIGRGADQFMNALRTSYSQDSVVIDLQQSLAAFRMRDAEPYCFELPHGLLLAERGFVLASENDPVSPKGRLRWQALNPVLLGAKMGGNYAKAVEEMNRGLASLIQEDLDQSKKPLGANPRWRDALVISDTSEDLHIIRWTFGCPCMLGICLSSLLLNTCWGKRFKDPR